MRIGILSFGRPTFDVDYARENLDLMLSCLRSLDCEIIGGDDLLFDSDSVTSALSDFADLSLDRLLILQVTFTDSVGILSAADLGIPLSIWSIPEPRLGGRLRLNSLCGMNLASHALGLRNRTFSWLYCSPSSVTNEQLNNLLSGEGDIIPRVASPVSVSPVSVSEGSARTLTPQKICKIGERPDGFATCDYDENELRDFGIEVETLSLSELFDVAESSATPDIDSLDVDGLDSVDQTSLQKSLRFRPALDSLRERGGYDAFAVRCWPECFVEYGGAVCGIFSQLGDSLVPCACEADVCGAVTQLILQQTSEQPVFLADIVDADSEDDTIVFWHCGQAPSHFASDTPVATIHSNRRLPLLYEFALRPGRATFFRFSRSFNQTKFVISTGEILERPISYGGTSGVVRMDSSSSEFLDGLVCGGVEHHMALTYGDHRSSLISVASSLGLPVLEI